MKRRPIICILSVIVLLLIISTTLLPVGMTSRQYAKEPVPTRTAPRTGNLTSSERAASFQDSSAAPPTMSTAPGAAMIDEDNLILLNAGAIDTTTPEAQELRRGSALGGKQMRLVQFAGPIRPEWYAALKATGARIVTYIPNNAYLVYGTSRTLRAVRAFASKNTIVQWDGVYTAAYRIDPTVNSQPSARGSMKDRAKAPERLNLSAKGNEQFTIQLVEDPDENAASLALIEGYQLEPIIKQDSVLGYVNVTVALPKEALNAIAERGDVVSIQPWITPQKLDERQNQIMAGNLTGGSPTAGDYLAYLASHGFTFDTPSTFAVNVSDSGIDNATTTPNHFGFYALGDPTNPAASRIIYNRLLGTSNAGSTLQGCDGHGNLNSHIIGGYVPTGGIFAAFPHADASGFRYGLGIAPFVKIGSSVIFDPAAFTSPTYQNLESQAYRDGARISNNSWGAFSNAYTSDSQQYDALVRDAQPDSGCSMPDCISAVGNQEYVIVFAAGNFGSIGSGVNTVASPSTAKNVITVGAAENVQAFGGADGCGRPDTGADNANDIINTSSRGPTADGRTKPDIMGPGTHVSGGVPQASIASPTGTGNGLQLACFVASGVCGGPIPSLFFPLGQQWYTASSGTSHSAPAIAGTAALYRQFFINSALVPPTPAMTKALMLNSARYMTGVLANDTLPSNNQGMGEANLNSFFDIFTSAHSFHDQSPADTFNATGQQRMINGSVGDGAKPFRVTLAWTDAPGPTSGSAFVNNLDLEVTVGGNTYKGNVFSGAFSASGGTADTRNNVESVFIPAGVTGDFVVTVNATNIAGDGVPNTGGPLDQDFALVIYNGTEAGPAPSIAINDVTITEGNAGTSVAGFTVSLSNPSSQTITVNYETADNTATAGSDYVSTSGTVTFTPGQVSQPVSITVNGDSLEEFNETFLVNLTNPVNATFSDNQGVGTINNDDVLATLPAGFSETQITGNGLSNATAIAIHPDGRIFVCQQTGELRVIKNGAVLATPFTTLPVNSLGERGLLGIAFDPNYATNRFVYVYYTATTPSIHNRVSRFTADSANEDVAVVGSELPILDLENLSATNHNGGAIHFGPDGKLYVAVGENANSNNSQSLANRLGKMLRINSDGTIPSDNPTTFSNIAGSPTGNNRAIWAVGLRNPYTFSFQPGTGRMHINDVGANAWEEINLGTAGANYGWGVGCEGTCGVAGMTNPIYQYSSAGAASECAITGGAFYNPTTPTFPAEYIGKYFFADFCGGWLKTLDPLNPPATGTAVNFATGISFPVDIQVANDGSLYYLARGSNSVFRVQYFGGSTLAINDLPITEGNAGTSVANFTVFLSSASSQTVTVQYATANNTALSGTDYVATSGTLTFTPGQLSQPVSVTINGDAMFEPDETFTVHLSNASGATISDADGTGTISNDDSPSISGHVNYADTITPVRNVTMTLTAPSFTTQTTTTDSNGDYTFAGVPAGNNYTLTPSKTGDVNGLESFDASFVARYTVGLDLPTANQRIAADADGDGILTSFDASLIARSVAGLPDTGIVGTWRFVPVSRSYQALSGDQTGQNFTAILVGDAGGNWTASIFRFAPEGRHVYSLALFSLLRSSVVAPPPLQVAAIVPLPVSLLTERGF